MPHIVIFVKYPSHMANKVIERLLEARKKNLFPDDESIQENLVLSAGKFSEDGIRNMSVTLVKEGKLEEALNSVYKEVAYYSEIEGFEASVEVWVTFQEGLQALGIELP
ncbi:MAG: hypothetical protein ACE5H4_09725 [Candidatus Thorarchaeota archaeon]